ncbi:protein ARABIDILLO 2-like [Aristolochia californica]|uniref:protein ARABIDILLO 2-like n=1 Tax=Aristolochia californica TaxID=171875 RepID=UPI0035D8AA67
MQMQGSSTATTLDLILHLLPLLLLQSLSPRAFTTRWHSISSKLSHLQSSLSQIDAQSSSTQSNPLLHQLLPNLLSTLQKTKYLAQLCCGDPPSAAPTIGKLQLQSDLDIASSSLALHLHDLDLLLKSGLLSSTAAAIVLSHPTGGSSKEDVAFFVRDVFARLQIGGLEFKKKALDSLLQLLHEDGLAEGKNVHVVSDEGDLPYLIHLLDSGSYPSSIREQAVSAVALLTTASDSAKTILFEEGVLGPLLRLLESGSSAVKEKAAAAVYAITSDPENAWAISAYGGVTALIDACRSGSPATRTHASGTMMNVATVEDVQHAMVEENAVPVLVELLAAEGPTAGNAAKCVSILASCGDEFRVLIERENGLQKLLELLQEPPNPDTLEHSLRAIYALSPSPSTARALSSSAGFLLQLAELIKQGNPSLQQISASLICSLSLNDSTKRAISCCMGSLVKMLELPKPVGLQEVAARALVSLLVVRANRKDLARDEKSITKLVLMLDPNNERVCKKFPMMVVSALLLGRVGARKRLVAAGACKHLQALADMEVPGARKIMQKLAGNRLKNILNRGWRD